MEPVNAALVPWGNSVWARHTKTAKALLDHGNPV